MFSTEIETPRLILRQWQETDKQAFITMGEDKDVMKYFPSTLTHLESLASIERIHAHFKQYGYGLFALERKDNGAFIGYTGFWHPTFESFFTPCVEIGWRLSKANWNMGFAQEAARACLQFGFWELGLKEIYSFTSVHNLPSINVMQKIGMKETGFFEHPKIEAGNWLRKHVLYKISVKEGLNPPLRKT